MGHLAAASGKSQPVFYGRCGILTVTRNSGFVVDEKLGSTFSLFGMPMKKSRKQQNRKRPSKRIPHAKQRNNLQKKKIDSPHSHWLQILPGDIEDVPVINTGRGFISQRNGRRERRDNGLYLAERNSSSGRIIR
ncbi:MAG TPA: hypothetical protein VHS29_00785 [Candidatus Acidoferrales bacterium]|nr:hypothetical protein [Candidatus Acidoferrales bacterium]